jgi:hypothetical protein
LILI